MKIILVALAMVITLALLTQSVVAGTLQLIIMTENSPSSLAVTLNGSSSNITVTNTSADHWTLTFPTTIRFNENGTSVFGWIEPDNSANGNIVSSPLQDNVLFVVSDALGHPGDHTDGAFVVVGNDTGSNEEVARFFDQAAAIEAAPEPATWGVGALLAGSLFFQFFLRKRAA